MNRKLVAYGTLLIGFVAGFVLVKFVPALGLPLFIIAIGSAFWTLPRMHRRMTRS